MFDADYTNESLVSCRYRLYGKRVRRRGNTFDDLDGIEAYGEANILVLVFYIVISWGMIE